MAGNGDVLRTRRWRAIKALMTAPSIKEAAEQSEISERTLHRWLHERAFRDSYQRACELALEEAISTLRGMAGQAVKVLMDALHSDSEPLRVRSALGALDLAAKLDHHFRRRLDDVDLRLTREQTREVAVRMAMVVKNFITDPEQLRAFAEELDRACGEERDMGVPPIPLP